MSNAAKSKPDENQQALQAKLGEIKHKFSAGQIDGLETAGLISDAHDNLLCTLFAKELAAHNLPPDQQVFSLCAVGGYGRGEMAPYSDLDLLFLFDGKTAPEPCSQIASSMLYALWDLGLKVGHAVRNIDQTAKLAREDETVLSALLDLRLIAGSPSLEDALRQKLRKDRSRARSRHYVKAKLAARDGRHKKAGNSRYVIEPNVKEGKGGLRDLHELYWIARYLFAGTRTKGGAPAGPNKVAAYLRHGLLDKDSAERFGTAAEFLWRTRIHLHYQAGRALEVLSFDRQAQLAKIMNYAGNREERIEAFMRDYFQTTREVGAITRIACAQLESQNALLLPQGLDRLLPTSRRGLKQPGFVLDHGRLNFTSAASIKKQPARMLELFLIAGQRNLDIHPDAFAALRKFIHLIDDDLRADPDAAQIFFDILLTSKAPGMTLQSMNEAGILGAYLPEFGGIVGRTQFNMHHAYTVDDHTISLVKFLHDIESGRLVKSHPLTSAFTQNWETRRRLFVYLACLLHDVGKGEGDQCIEGARLSMQATKRLGLPDEDVETVSWLVRNHLLMSETAQRRDTTDPGTIAAFAKQMGSVTRLQMLTALTCVDIRAVGPGIWNDWKGELIRQLYSGALQTLMGVPAEEAAEKVRIEARLSKLSDSERSAEHFVKARPATDIDVTEIWVLADDRRGLFAALTGTLSSCGAMIAGAQLHTGSDGRIFDIFFLQNSEGKAFGRRNPARLKKLEQKTLAALKGKTGRIEIPAALESPRAKAIPIRSRISIMPKDKENSIIELEGRDRPGLLYDLARVIDNYRLSIRSAHIEVAGPRAIDVFYVAHDAGAELTAGDLERDLQRALDGPAVKMPTP